MSATIKGWTVQLVGCGQMGGAMARGWLASGTIDASRLLVHDASDEAAEALASELGLEGRPHEEAPSIWVFAVKPHQMAEALATYSTLPGDVVISVAAGLTLDTLTAWAPPTARVVRAMPNVCARVGASTTGLFSHDAEALALAEALFEGVGEAVVLPRESDFDAFTAIAGSGPAFLFVLMEAMADAGVQLGLTRQLARQLVTSTFAGSAQLIAGDEAHTAEWKDRVASPGGTTIAGLAELESHGARVALWRAVLAAARRSASMG